jgi:SAM-dependent methyltransferase
VVDTHIRVFEGDATDKRLDLPKSHYGLVIIAEVVSSHIYDLDHLHRLFEVVDDVLRPDGCVLLFGTVLTPRRRHVGMDRYRLT